MNLNSEYFKYSKHFIDYKSLLVLGHLLKRTILEWLGLSGEHYQQFKLAELIM